MNNYSRLLLIPILFLTLFLKAQDDIETKSVQEYTPTVLLDKGQAEFKLFNSLYTQIEFFDEDGNKQDAGGRSTYFTSVTEFNYGLSPRVALGGELWFRSVYNGPTNSSATKVFTFSNSPEARTGITLIGMKLKINPIRKWENFSAQTALLLSVISDPQSENLDRPFLDNNRHLWITKFLYDKMIFEKILLFTQLSTWMSIDKNLSDENTSLATPADLFISYFPTNKITIYLQNQIWPSWGGDGLSSYFVQEGLGFKYQISRGIELETSYSVFIIGKETGAGESFNLGIRILH